MFTCSALAQGTSIFDQQSSTDESGLVGGVLFQTVQPFGESFKPALSGIDFVRLYMDPGGPTRPDATVYVNLPSGSISGTVLASTSPLSLHNSFFGYTNFFFPTTVTLTPGTTYYLQPVASAGNPYTDIGAGFLYPNGSLFQSGVAQPAEQLWFREGVVVPEASSVSLLAVGITMSLHLNKL